MRPIRFRGYSTVVGRWFYGDLCQCPNGVKVIVDDDANAIEVDPDSVGQMTGETDVKGRPIYEGDVLREWHYGKRFPVVPVDCGWAVKYKNVDGTYTYMEIIDVLLAYDVENVGPAYGSNREKAGS